MESITSSEKFYLRGDDDDLFYTANIYNRTGKN